MLTLIINLQKGKLKDRVMLTLISIGIDFLFFAAFLT